MTTAFFHHPDCEAHDMGDGHPESPARLGAIREGLTRSGLMEQLLVTQPEEASRDQLRRAHPDSYIDQLEQMAPARGRVMADPDTAITPHTLRAARLAAGAGVEAVNQVMTNQALNAFCAVRPPGHHAERQRTMGFSFFNNIAIAALHALTFHHLERVAILDFDVHQGNGTVDIFQNDPRVLMCSSFQHPFYPHKHYHGVPDHIINVKLPAGMGSEAYREAISEDWFGAVERFRPQLILVSAGFDAHRLDPLADINLETGDYRWITERITRLAADHCRGRVVSMLEGGYNLQALADSLQAHLEVLLEAGSASV